MEPLGLMELPPQLTAPGTAEEHGATVEFQDS
jgi:hypothetical protein